MPVAALNATTQSRPLRTSDPRLPLIITKAAIEFDNADQGRQSGFTAAKQLAEFLRASFEQPAATPPEKMSLDVGTVGIVGRALDESAWKGPIKNVSEVVDQAREIADSMGNIPPANGNSYVRLRAFCVALGNSLLAYRESLRESRPTSPYRR